MTTRIYLAGPLFSQAHRQFNLRLADTLRQRLPDITVKLPQEYSQKLEQTEAFPALVFNDCIESIQAADMLLCILDGADADSGTCIEMGYAYAMKKKIIGLRTDSRNSEDRGVNAMVSGVCGEYIWLPRQNQPFESLVEKVAEAVKRLTS